MFVNFCIGLLTVLAIIVGIWGLIELDDRYDIWSWLGIAAGFIGIVAAGAAIGSTMVSGLISLGSSVRLWL